MIHMQTQCHNTQVLGAQSTLKTKSNMYSFETVHLEYDQQD